MSRVVNDRDRPASRPPRQFTRAHRASCRAWRRELPRDHPRRLGGNLSREQGLGAIYIGIAATMVSNADSRRVDDRFHLAQVNRGEA